MIGVLPSLVGRQGGDPDGKVGGRYPYSTVMEAAKDIPFRLAYSTILYFITKITNVEPSLRSSRPMLSF